jgi:hypothetical protein
MTAVRRLITVPHTLTNSGAIVPRRDAHDARDVRHGSKTEVAGRMRHVCFTPIERTRFRGRGWRRGRAITSAAVTL